MSRLHHTIAVMVTKVKYEGFKLDFILDPNNANNQADLVINIFKYNDPLLFKVFPKTTREK